MGRTWPFLLMFESRVERHSSCGIETLNGHMYSAGCRIVNGPLGLGRHRMRVRYDFVLFCFCLILYSSIAKTCTPFWYQRDCKEIVIIVYHIFFYIMN